MKKKDLKEHRANHAMIRKFLPEDMNDTMEVFFDFMDFHLGVSEALQEACRPPLRKLVNKHYPELTAAHPVIEEYIKDINDTTMYGIAYKMKILVEDMKKGVNLEEKYPKLEEWREFYVRPKPETMEGVERNMFLFPDDASWEKHVEEENRELYRLFCWEEHRKTEFYDVVQPELFKLYPVLEDLEGDCWVLYAVNMRDEYEIWMSELERAEGIVLYEMPPESVNWEWEDYRKEKSARFKKYHKSAQAKRDAMIDSFEI